LAKEESAFDWYQINEDTTEHGGARVLRKRGAAVGPDARRAARVELRKRNLVSMLPPYSRFGHSATVLALRALLLHAYMSLDMFPTLVMEPCPPPGSAPHPSVRNRTVAPCPVPQVGVAQVSCEQGPTCSQRPPMPS